MTLKIHFAFIAAAAAAAVLYPQFLPLAVCAALHELSHMAAMALLRIRIRSIEFSIGGIRLECGMPRGAKATLTAAAGPLGGLIPAAVGWFAKDYALIQTSLALSAFNLIPVYPLDGEKLLSALLSALFSPQTAEKLASFFSAIILVVSLLAGIFVAAKSGNAALLLTAAALVILRLKNAPKF